MKQQIQDIIDSAVGGPAIVYWAKGSNFVYQECDEDKPNSPRAVVSFVVRDGDPDGTGAISKARRTINEKSILAAREKLLNEDCDIHRTIAAQFVGPMEKWDWDQDGVDALIQVALFGKVVYG